MERGHSETKICLAFVTTAFEIKTILIKRSSADCFSFLRLKQRVSMK